MDEEWRAVIGWEGLYEASSLGRIRSLDRLVHTRAGRMVQVRGRVLSPFTTKWGYLMVSLWTGNADLKMTVHSLIASAFIGPRPLGMDVNHRNGIKIDNQPRNLEYATRGDNLSHAYRSGLKNTSGVAKLTAAQAREIRSKYTLGGVTQRELAGQYGISRENVSAIYRGKTWREIQCH